MASSTAPERGRNIDLDGAYAAAEERFTATNPKSLAQYERACESLLGNGGEDGRMLFESALAWAKGTPTRV